MNKFLTPFKVKLAIFIESQINPLLSLSTSSDYRSITWDRLTQSLSIKIGYRNSYFILLSIKETGIKWVYLNKDTPEQVGEVPPNKDILRWINALSKRRTFVFSYRPKDIG